jgi:hypothetical protein
MGLGIICHCGHTKTDHYGRKHDGECEWYDCNCQKFNFKENRNLGAGGNYAIN